MGDFNRVDISPINRAHATKQVVDKPTRGNAILDIIITNIKNCYNSPIVSSPVGRSDHNTVYWSPNVIKTTGSVNKITVRPLLKPRMYEFGRWITKHTWDEVLNSPLNMRPPAYAFMALPVPIVSTPGRTSPHDTLWGVQEQANG